MKTIEQYPDMEVISRVISGDSALFEILIRRYNAALYKTGRCYQFDHDLTQDLMQDTFIDAYCNLSKFENRSSFKTWLIRIMLNNCYRKKQKYKFRHETSFEISEKSIPMFADKNQSNTSRAVANKELGEIVESAIQRIPIEYRMVFSLREINGLNVMETAEALDITPVNVKVRLNRAKAMLREEIEKSYSSEEIYEFNLIYCDAMVNRVMTRLDENQQTNE